jgi:hypothetical protein
MRSQIFLSAIFDLSIERLFSESRLNVNHGQQFPQVCMSKLECPNSKCALPFVQYPRFDLYLKRVCEESSNSISEVPGFGWRPSMLSKLSKKYSICDIGRTKLKSNLDVFQCRVVGDLSS